MKRIILSILLATACISASATEQINDKIIINGETWEVLSSPIESLDEQTSKALEALRGEISFTSTANYRGYIAYWYVKRGRLYLDRIEMLEPNGRYKAIEEDKLKSVFKKYRRWGKIKAGWMTGNLDVGYGSGSRDPENPFLPVFEENNVLTLKKGRITKISE